jgi:predicted glutamine amidotransferase
MCEIQIINRFKEDINDEDKSEFIRMMTKGAYSNRDAFGFFNRTNTYKLGTSFEKKSENMKVRNIIDGMSGNFIVGHNRLSTKGDAKDNKNNHPFETKNWIVVHNGVLYNDDEIKKLYKFRYNEKVDSAIIPALLEYFTKEGKTELEAVKTTAEEISGWYSIICYHKPTNTMYYFKNSKTDFFMALIEDDRGKVLVASTNEDTIEDCYTKYDMIFSKPKYHRKTIVEPAEEIIYKIDGDRIQEVDGFTENTASTYIGYSKQYDRMKGYDEFSPDWDDYDENDFENKTNISDWEHDFPKAREELSSAQTELLELGKVGDISSIQTDYNRGCIKVKQLDSNVFYDIANSFPSAEIENGWIIVNFEDFLTHEFVL